MVSNNDLLWFQKELYELHNKIRKEHKLNQLIISKKLEKLAKKHSEEMASYEEIYHSTLSKNENVACAPVTEYGQEHTISEEIMKGWLHSDGHFKNIVNSDIQKIGIGIALDDYENPYFTVLFE